jgi:hypothetical protein
MIVLQVSLIAAAGIVLYFLARHYLSVPLSVMIVASYYGANGVIGPTLVNFTNTAKFLYLYLACS